MGFGVWGLGFGVWGLGIRAVTAGPKGDGLLELPCLRGAGLGFRVLGFRV